MADTMIASVELARRANQEARAAVTYYGRTGRLPEGLSVRAYGVIQHASYGNRCWLEEHSS